MVTQSPANGFADEKLFFRGQLQSVIAQPLCIGVLPPTQLVDHGRAPDPKVGVQQPCVHDGLAGWGELGFSQNQVADDTAETIDRIPPGFALQ